MSPRRFRPSIVGTILTLVSVSLFLSLTLWQWQRAEQKSSMQAAFSRALNETPLEVSKVQLPAHRFRRASVKGRYVTSQVLFIDNVVYNGRAGYRIVSPFRTEDENIVIVDRGWVPLGSSRQILPEIDTPERPLTIVGTVDRPKGKPFALDAALLEQSMEKALWPWLDIETFSQRIGERALPFLLRLEANAAGAYKTELVQFDARVGMHIGYAIQWLIFAIVSLALYIYFSFRSADKT